jgi:hypothetical protein
MKLVIYDPTHGVNESYSLGGGTVPLDQIVLFGGSNDRFYFTNSSNDLLVANGPNQSVGFIGRNDHIQVVDAGKNLFLQFGTLIGPNTDTNISVYDFQNHPGGQIELINQTTLSGVSLTSDHHGGTMLHGGNVSVDFVEDSHLTLKQISISLH